MIRAYPTVIVVLVCAGMSLLCASLLPIRSILRMVRVGLVRRNWFFLTSLILLFIPGYAIFGWLRARNHPTVADLVVATILFFGGGFVFSVAHLSRETAKDLLRIAGLERDAFVDPLTQLFNRRYLSLRFNEEVSRAHRYKLKLVVIMVDIDHFKLVNDIYGHRAGDDVLNQIARVVGAELRTCDIAVRYGGDEILLIATNTDTLSGNAIAERLRRRIKEMMITSEDGPAILITASIGVAALLPKEGTGALMDRVDRALYQAKQEGRDRVCTAGANETTSPKRFSRYSRRRCIAAPQDAPERLDL